MCIFFGEINISSFFSFSIVKSNSCFHFFFVSILCYWFISSTNKFFYFDRLSGDKINMLNINK